MLEILDRGGLGRTGRWEIEGREVRTPTVLFVHRPRSPAPPFAEALLTAEPAGDPRPQVRVGGSFFAPRPEGPGPALPPTMGLPATAADIEVPQAVASGSLALITSEADVASARGADAVFLANGAELARDPRNFLSWIARVRETLGPMEVVGVTGLATPANLAGLVYAGVDLVDSSRVLLDSARALFHTADGSLPIPEADRNA